jgi:N-acetyl sugar amidotransferase
MDTTDPLIQFDEQGICNHCHEFENNTKKRWFPNEEGEKKLESLITQIKASGAKRPYDCIIGLSGGVDSSYLALKAKDWGLRPLVVHVDAGWNSELAIANIEKIVKYCGYQLYTHVVDWEDMRQLQLAYLKSGISNQDVPQDHVFFASLYHFAMKHRIKYLLSGGNIATEGIFPKAWHGDAMDAKNLRAIYRRYGEGKLKSYTTINSFKYYFWYPFVKGMRTIRPLNFIPYNKSEAIRELETTLSWRSYEYKHGESIFTRFFQNHYLPVKFGFDKRRPHLSSLIVSGQITREEAKLLLNNPLYQPDELERDISYFCKKLTISREEFERLMQVNIQHYSDFPNRDNLYRLIKKTQAYISKVGIGKISIYS